MSRLLATPVQATATKPAQPKPVSSKRADDGDGSSQPYACGDAGSAAARQVRADVDIDYAGKTATVDQRLTFVNRGDDALGSIVIDVQANQWQGSFALDALLLAGAPVAYELSLNRLEIPLSLPLRPGCQLEIGLRFRLTPELITEGLRSYRGFFGYSPRQLNLAHFLPVVAARPAGEWRIHAPIGIGEQIVYEVADWQVHVRVRGASQDLKLAAPGTVERIGAGEWRIGLLNSRDFAISLSEHFQLSQARTEQGVKVSVYSFAGGRGIDGESGAEHVLATTVAALELFTELFGDYPYERLALVQGDFPDGMEFTSLVFVGSAWFTHFEGGPRNYLTLISVHEIAHQWWYARVGSDAALYPWLDEALATYSEYLFIESRYPADKNWWWTFRVAGFFPQGAVDSAVYAFSSVREYIDAIYLRGVQMLHNLRGDIGDDAFFSHLRAYARKYKDRIADPPAFWALLPPEQARLTLATRREFLRDPSISALFATASETQE